MLKHAGEEEINMMWNMTPENRKKSKPEVLVGRYKEVIFRMHMRIRQGLNEAIVIRKKGLVANLDRRALVINLVAAPRKASVANLEGNLVENPEGTAVKLARLLRKVGIAI